MGVHRAITVPAVSVVALAAVEISAMHYGHDGSVLLIVVAVISALGGYSIGRFLPAPYQGGDNGRTNTNREE